MLRAAVIPILNAARSSSSLKFLDISGNACNDAAKEVAAMLMGSRRAFVGGTQLEGLRWDGNGTKISGFEAVCGALQVVRETDQSAK